MPYEWKSSSVELECPDPATFELIKAEVERWEEKLKHDLNQRLFPNGRDEAVERLNKLAGLDANGNFAP